MLDIRLKWWNEVQASLSSKRLHSSRPMNQMKLVSGWQWTENLNKSVFDSFVDTFRVICAANNVTDNSYFLLIEKYCHLFLCVHCLKENVACTQNGQCCEGQCTYGRCKAGVTEGQPGTFCDRHEDCAGEGKAACCVRCVSAHSSPLYLSSYSLFSQQGLWAYSEILIHLSVSLVE